ncbi:MAG: Flp pilus assembly complex ATPase component TadA [Phycisphaerales bacterium]|nr:Flp pilus assembly complex ATPase component TadA [Phycisphaerales bacterium]
MTLELRCSSKEIGMVPLDGRTLSIGRHPDNDIWLKEDDMASRFHCVVEPEDDGWLVKDLGSRNGTYVNDEQVVNVRLAPGDTLRVGKHEFEVRSRARKRTSQGAQAAGGAAPTADKKHGRVGPQLGAVTAEPDRSTGESWEPQMRAVLDTLAPGWTRQPAPTLIDADGTPTGVLDTGAGPALGLRLTLLVAQAAHATDIHFEPRRDNATIRMRIDGTMVHIANTPSELSERMLSMVRTACQFRQAARNAVQDGHFGVRYPDRRVDFRASLTPTVHGSKLVLRVLDARFAPRSVAELRMPDWIRMRIDKTCEQEAGMLMVAGPTGSGKTTTLHNCIRSIDREARNVITIEDPVEYHLEHTTQIPVTEDQGFGSLLRSVLRQDPDVILVGEIRDDETARTAMQAAMTGHLVFSTVHAKDAIGAVFRLLDLGVEPYLVANSIEVILAQRLIRLLCESCKRAVRVTPGQATKMGRFLEGRDELFVPTGCTRCLRTGFSGRRAVFEMIEFNDELRDCVLGKPSIQAMKAIIERGVFHTLQESGWLLAANGQTSLEEIERIAG